MLNLFYVKANQYSEHLAYDILTFSELLRYSLKDDNKEFVAIEDEIEVVKKMLHLFNNRLDSHTTGRLDIGDIPSDFKIPSSMLVLIYQSLLTNADKVKIDFHVFINYADEKLQIKVNYTSKLSNKKISFTILKERLNFIYNTNYFFHETQSDSHSELIIVLPHRN
jgi:LytS/YehU family sensor histidine kinase